jgi:hypothetical protein
MEFLKSFFKTQVERDIEELITRSKDLGLPERDIANALNMLTHNEWGEAFDIIVVQMYEYHLRIDEGFWDLARKIQGTMQLPENEYEFLDKLLVNEDAQQSQK